MAIADQYPIEGIKPGVYNQNTMLIGDFIAFVTAIDLIDVVKQAANRLGNHLDLLHIHAALRRDFVLTAKALNEFSTAGFVLKLIHRQAGNEKVDFFHLRKQKARMKQCLIGICLSVIRMQRPLPHFGTISRNARDKRLLIHKNVQKLVL